jgi:hypothetical protein
MRSRDPAKAMHVLDLLLAFLADGAQWLQRDFLDAEGNRCLVDALSHLRRKHGNQGRRHRPLSARRYAPARRTGFLQRPLQELRRTARGDQPCPCHGAPRLAKAARMRPRHVQPGSTARHRRRSARQQRSAGPGPLIGTARNDPPFDSGIYS